MESSAVMPRLAQLVSPEAVEAARGLPPLEALVKLGVSREEAERFLRTEYGGPYGGWSCDLSMTPVDPAALAAAPRAAVGLDVMWGVASPELIDDALRAWEAGEPVGPR